MVHFSTSVHIANNRARANRVTTRIRRTSYNIQRLYRGPFRVPLIFINGVPFRRGRIVQSVHKDVLRRQVSNDNGRQRVIIIHNRRRQRGASMFHARQFGHDR